MGGGELKKVIQGQDILDGKVVSGPNFDREGVSDSVFAMTVHFDAGITTAPAIYVAAAPIPEPAPYALLISGAGLLVIVAWWRGRTPEPRGRTNGTRNAEVGPRQGFECLANRTASEG
jgi:hypothetical protein